MRDEEREEENIIIAARHYRTSTSVEYYLMPFLNIKARINHIIA